LVIHLAAVSAAVSGAQSYRRIGNGKGDAMEQLAWKMGTKYDPMRKYVRCAEYSPLEHYVLELKKGPFILNDTTPKRY